MCIPVQFVRHQNCFTFPEDGASSVREVEIVPVSFGVIIRHGI